jgi:hypothetical protein
MRMGTGSLPSKVNLARQHDFSRPITPTDPTTPIPSHTGRYLSNTIAKVTVNFIALTCRYKLELTVTIIELQFVFRHCSAHCMPHTYQSLTKAFDCCAPARSSLSLSTALLSSFIYSNTLIHHERIRSLA